MVESTTLRFVGVGRGKKSWTSVLKPVTEDGILREIRRHGGLMSRDVGAEISDDGTAGVVVVGGFREVGAFTIEPALPKELP
jgi:hypothetical protein